MFWLYIISIILGGSLYLLNDTITLESNGLVFSKGTIGYNVFTLFTCWFNYFYLNTLNTLKKL
ncbi:MAG: hypothetical protein L6V78_06155 [Clostridium sp.]|nr:MAG: hypothetical protein L6V78_06155 [Clostridium sp.]